MFADESPFASTNFTWLGWYSLQTCLRNTLPKNVSLYLKLISTSQVSSVIQTYEKERIKVTAPLLEKSRQGGLDSHAEDHTERLTAVFMSVDHTISL